MSFKYFLSSWSSLWWNCVCYDKTAPPLNVQQVLTFDEPSILYDDKGQYMDKVITNEQRIVVDYKNVPQNLKMHL